MVPSFATTSAPNNSRAQKLSGGGLHLAQCGSHFLQVRHHRNVVVLEPRHFALLVHDGDGAARDSFVSQAYPGLFAHPAPRTKIPTALFAQSQAYTSLSKSSRAAASRAEQPTSV